MPNLSAIKGTKKGASKAIKLALIAIRASMLLIAIGAVIERRVRSRFIMKLAITK